MAVFLSWKLLCLVPLVIPIVWVWKWIVISCALPHRMVHNIHGKKMVGTDYKFKNPPVRGHNFIYYPLVHENATTTLVYFHGNGDLIKAKYLGWKDEPDQLKANIIMVEYPGYDQNPDHSWVTEQTHYESVWNSWISIQDRFGKTKIHLVGHSIGTSFASYVWHRNSQLQNPYQCSGLLLMSPFESILRIVLGRSFLSPLLDLIDVLPVHRFLKDYKGYIMIVYSEDDTTTPPDHAKRLIEQTGAVCGTYKGNHRDLIHEMKIDVFKKYLMEYGEWSRGK